jgi:hypothetical protein
MSDRRRSLLILLLVFGLIAASAVVVATKPTKLGLDLQGGVQLVYEGQPTPQQPTVDQQALDRALQIMRDRVDAFGVAEPELQLIGGKQIEVNLPGVANADRALPYADASFGAVASTGTSVPLITQASSEQSICFAVPTESANQVLEALQKNFAIELFERDIDRVWATEEVAIITAVGSGTRNTPGVAGQIFGKLGDKEINVLAIAHGSSDVSISMVVETKDTEIAVRALHELIVQ